MGFMDGWVIYCAVLVLLNSAGAVVHGRDVDITSLEYSIPSHHTDYPRGRRTIPGQNQTTIASEATAWTSSLEVAPSSVSSSDMSITGTAPSVTSDEGTFTSKITETVIVTTQATLPPGHFNTTSSILHGTPRSSETVPEVKTSATLSWTLTLTSNPVETTSSLVGGTNGTVVPSSLSGDSSATTATSLGATVTELATSTSARTIPVSETLESTGNTTFVSPTRTVTLDVPAVTGATFQTSAIRPATQNGTASTSISLIITSTVTARSTSTALGAGFSFPGMNGTVRSSTWTRTSDESTTALSQSTITDTALASSSASTTSASVLGNSTNFPLISSASAISNGTYNPTASSWTSAVSTTLVTTYIIPVISQFSTLSSLVNGTGTLATATRATNISDITSATADLNMGTPTSETLSTNTATTSVRNSWAAALSSSLAIATYEQTSAQRISIPLVLSPTGKGNFTVFVPVGTLSGTASTTTISVQRENTHRKTSASGSGNSILAPGSTGSATPQTISSTTASPSSTRSEAPTASSTLTSLSDSTYPSHTTLNTRMSRYVLLSPSASATISASTIAGSPGGNNNDNNEDKKEETPALSPPEKAGIAIGGTACVIIALVATLFVARRYHQKAEKRKGKGDMYPEVAYLYDPSIPRNSDDGDDDGGRGGSGGGTYMMSSAATGYGAAAPRNTPESSTSSRPSPNAQNAIPQLDPNRPIRDPGPSNRQDPGPSRKPNAKYSLFAITPYAYNPAAEDYPPMSPYDKPDMNFLFTKKAQLQSSTMTQAPDQPKPDILIPVVPFERSKTPDTVLMRAPPPMPDTVRHIDFKLPTYPHPPTSLQTSDGSPSVQTVNPETSPTFTLPQTVYSPPPTIYSSSSASTPDWKSSTPPTCRSWEDISVTDNDDANDDEDSDKENQTPASSTASTPKPPVPLKVPMTIARKPVPPGAGAQSERPGTERAVLSGQGLPMAMKEGKEKKTAPEVLTLIKGLGFDFSFLLTENNTGNADEERMSMNSVVVKRRRSELEFAEPGLVGRERF